MLEDRYYVQQLTEQIFLIRQRTSVEEEPGPDDSIVRSFNIRHDAYIRDKCRCYASFQIRGRCFGFTNLPEQYHLLINQPRTLHRTASLGRPTNRPTSYDIAT